MLRFFWEDLTPEKAASFEAAFSLTLLGADTVDSNIHHKAESCSILPSLLLGRGLGSTDCDQLAVASLADDFVRPGHEKSLQWLDRPYAIR